MGTRTRPTLPAALLRGAAALRRGAGAGCPGRAQKGDGPPAAAGAPHLPGRPDGTLAVFHLFSTSFLFVRSHFSFYRVLRPKTMPDSPFTGVGTKKQPPCRMRAAVASCPPVKTGTDGAQGKENRSWGGPSPKNGQGETEPETPPEAFPRAAHREPPERRRYDALPAKKALPHTARSARRAFTADSPP